MREMLWREVNLCPEPGLKALETNGLGVGNAPRIFMEEGREQ
jgi:hypothetical protein